MTNKKTTQSATKALFKLRWRWGLVALAPVLVFACGPTVVSSTPIGAWLARRAMKSAKLNGTVERIAIGWLTDTQIDGLEIRDGENRTMVSIPRVVVGRNLLQLSINRQHLGVVRVEKPVVQVYLEQGKTNVEQALAAMLSDAGPSDQRSIAKITVVDGSLFVAEDQAKWEFTPIAAEVELPAEAGVFHCKGSARGAERAKNADIQWDVRLASSQAAGVLALEQLPASLLAVVARRWAPDLVLAGAIGGKLEAQAGATESDASIGGRLEFRDLEVSSPHLGPDTVRLARVEAPIRLAAKQGVWHVQEVGLNSEIGSIAIVGPVEISRLEKPWLASHLNIQVDVDLPKVAQQLPRTLALREGLDLRSGKARFSAKSQPSEANVDWHVHLETEDLVGQRAGQTLAWRSPLNADFQVRIDPTGLFAVPQARCASDFLTVQGSGDQDNVDLVGKLDLGRLAEPLGQFVDLSKTQLGGTADLRWSIRKRPDGRRETQARVEGQNLRWVSAGAVGWREDRVAVTLSAVGQLSKDGAQSWEACRFTAHADGDVVTISAAGPVQRSPANADKPIHFTGAFDFTVDGDLARWQKRLSPIVGFHAYQASGQVNGSARLVQQTDGLQLDQVRFAARDFSLTGPGFSMREPTFQVTGAANSKAGDTQWDLTDIQLSCPTGTLSTGSLSVARQPSGWSAFGATKITVDLGRLSGMLAPGEKTPAFTGALKGDLTFQPRDAQGTVVTVAANAEPFRVGDPRDPTWLEPRLRVEALAFAPTKSAPIILEKIVVAGEGYALNGRGSIDTTVAAVPFSIDGQLQSDWRSFSAKLQRDFQIPIQARGSAQRDFRLQGAICGKQSLLLSLDGQTKSAWENVSLLALQGGPAEIQATINNGWLRFEPVRLKLNQGDLLLLSQLRIEPEPMILTVRKPSALTRAQLTSESLAGSIGLALPWVAHGSAAQGEFSVTLEDSVVPLANPNNAEVKGVLVLHQGVVEPGPLLRELGLILKTPMVLQLDREQVVPFHLRKGRVYHENVLLQVSGARLRSTGSVGLDGSLAINADVPLPKKLLNQVGATDSERVVTVPIRGTLKKPAIDPRGLTQGVVQAAKETARDAVRKEVGNQLQRIIKKKQP